MGLSISHFTFGFVPLRDSYDFHEASERSQNVDSHVEHQSLENDNPANRMFPLIFSLSYICVMTTSKVSSKCKIQNN